MVWDMLGAVNYALGKYENALINYNKVIKLEPNFTEAHYNIGIILDVLGRYEESIESYNQTVNLKPGHVEAHHNLGAALENLGKYKEARTSYERAIQLKPDYADTYFNLGNVLFDLEQYNEAAENYRNNIVLQPYSLNSYTRLGQIFDIEGKTTKAIFCYKSAIFSNTSVGMADVALRRINLERQQIQSAHEELNHTDIPSFDLQIHHLPVDSNLIQALYDLPNLSPVEEQNSILHRGSAGIRKGGIRISADYTLLDHLNPAIQRFKTTITDLLSSVVSGPIYISESFFNIYQSTSDAGPHNHFEPLDEKLQLGPHKYSVVYYLQIGEQSATNPGILNLYTPDHSINPKAGDVVIFPAERLHSVFYNGTTDRIILGINFYRV
ncbi:MAG: hypothetical protein CMM58_02040 [Rhodospirillaceae bacterium]|nr:hypothetical protein [Rhodospirillaceae bacterium]